MLQSITLRSAIALLFFSSLSVAGLAQNPRTSETILPANTKAWISIPNIAALKSAMLSTKLGQMTEDEHLKPFVDELTTQFKAWLDEQNIRFGIKVSDLQDVASGEIAVAGLLDTPAANAAPNHAMVLLVDVTSTREKAEALLQSVAEELLQRDATREEVELAGVSATKWSFAKPVGLRERQFAYHGIAGDWLVACDNENVFRDLARRITVEGGDGSVLARTQAFTEIDDKTRFIGKDYVSHIRWFVEPFGYVALVEALSEAKNGPSGPRNDYAERLREEGFSAIQGLGGRASAATGEHELVHRTCIYAPRQVEGDLKYLRGAAMLDFDNDTSDPLDPPAWIPPDAAGYLSFTLDLHKALIKVGHVLDATAGVEGSWQRSLEGIKKDMGVDVEALVQMFENRVTLITASELPVTESSERVLFGLNITGDPAAVAESIKKIVILDAEVVEHAGVEILVVDTTKVDDSMPATNFNAEFAEFQDYGNEYGDDEGQKDEEEVEEPKPLFEKRVFAVKGEVLLFGNNVEYVKKVIDYMEGRVVSELAEANDYQRIAKALGGLTVDGLPSFRHFGRMDKALRTNYEMMREGKMGQSKTILAQLLNRSLTEDDAPEGFVRKQKIDGSKLPEDYEKHVAKYFGPTGTIVQTLDDGWLITGCILEKLERVEQLVDQKNETGGSVDKFDE